MTCQQPGVGGWGHMVPSITSTPTPGVLIVLHALPGSYLTPADRRQRVSEPLCLLLPLPERIPLPCFLVPCLSRPGYLVTPVSPIPSLLCKGLCLPAVCIFLLVAGEPASSTTSWPLRTGTLFC